MVVRLIGLANLAPLIAASIPASRAGEGLENGAMDQLSNKRLKIPGERVRDVVGRPLNLRYFLERKVFDGDVHEV